MDISEKYRELKCEGKNSNQVAEALIIDGYGKLRVIAVLRNLYELSLNDATEMYELIIAGRGQ